MVEAVPVPGEHVVFTDFDGVEGILVDLNTKKYYQLNETAMLIWKGLEKRLSLTEIAADLCASYEITPSDALHHVEAIVKNLKAQRLVSL